MTRVGDSDLKIARLLMTSLWCGPVELETEGVAGSLGGGRRSNAPTAAAHAAAVGAWYQGLLVRTNVTVMVLSPGVSVPSNQNSSSILSSSQPPVGEPLWARMSPSALAPMRCL